MRTRFNRPLAGERTIGESWEIVSHGNDQSVAASGALAGLALGDLVARDRASLLGECGTQGKFPLLFKFIDARDRLSVQVHPDDGQARSRGWGEFGKTECWYVVDAARDARIIVGFKKNVTADAVRDAIAGATLQDMLNFIPVKPRDILFIPAGTVHAIMEGAFIYEVQETSDTTLRLYDWGRVDSHGKPRQLHVEDALGVLDTAAHDGYKIAPAAVHEDGWSRDVRVACRYFALEEYAFSSDKEIPLPARKSFRVLSVMNGAALLSFSGGSAEVPLGGTVFLPAVLRDVRTACRAGTRLMVSWVPDLQEEIVAPLRARGIPDAQILALGGFAQRNDIAPIMGR